MGVRLGLEAKLYRNTGTSGSPTWTEMTNVKDLTLNLEASEADVTTRGNAGWRATLAALKDASIEFEMVWDTADAAFTAIKDAFFGRIAGAASRDVDHELQPVGAAGGGDQRQRDGEAYVCDDCTDLDDGRLTERPHEDVH
jgi:hypothetical protein